MKEIYYVKDLTDQTTLGIYGTKNMALFAVGRYLGLKNPYEYYGDFCKALREKGVYNFVNSKKLAQGAGLETEVYVMAYELNKDLFDLEVTS